LLAHANFNVRQAAAEGLAAAMDENKPTMQVLFVLSEHDLREE